MGAWDNFFVAQVGASAALAGLLFVGISINMSRLLQYPRLLDRALEALAMLVTILVVASLTLIPVSTDRELGIEILLVGAAGLAIVTVLGRRILRESDPRFRRPDLTQTVLIESAMGLYVAAGACLIGLGGIGADLIAPAVLISYLVAIIIAWVLLVEVNR
jgi:predicted MFS family arabinose efflux permease